MIGGSGLGLFLSVPLFWNTLYDVKLLSCSVILVGFFLLSEWEKANRSVHSIATRVHCFVSICSLGESGMGRMRFVKQGPAGSRVKRGNNNGWV